MTDSIKENAINAEVVNTPKTELLEPPVTKAGLVKRTFAGIIDLFVVVFIFMMLQSFVTFPIAKAASKDYDTYQAKLVDEYVQSGLAIKTDKGLLEYIAEDKYIVNSQKYFEDYCGGSDATSAKACSTAQKSLETVLSEHKEFQKSFKDTYKFDGNALIITSDDENVKKNLPSAVYNIALANFASSEIITKYSSYLTTTQTWGNVTAIVIALALVYLLVPLITKNGQTLGKLTFHLGLVKQGGYKVHKSQVVVRFLAFSVVNVLLGLLTYMIVPFVSFIVMIVTKKNSSLHDFCSATMVVDLNSSTIYKDEKTYREFKEKEDAKIQEIDNRRQDYYDNLKK